MPTAPGLPAQTSHSKRTAYFTTAGFGSYQSGRQKRRWVEDNAYEKDGKRAQSHNIHSFPQPLRTGAGEKNSKSFVMRLLDCEVVCGIAANVAILAKVRAFS
jgi:hypothetical protein